MKMIWEIAYCLVCFGGAFLMGRHAYRLGRARGILEQMCTRKAEIEADIAALKVLVETGAGSAAGVALDLIKRAAGIDSILGDKHLAADCREWLEQFKKADQ